jgi:hypothetical protein
MTDLSETGLLPSKSSQTFKVFEENYADILTRPMPSSGAFMKKAWSEYMQGSSGLNGSVFESLISCLLYRNKITPLFVQAEITFVPNIVFDLVLYSEECGPIVLSLKTSLRERYKQADLEGMMLRNVHRNSLTYLITASEKDANDANAKIKAGSILGINKVYYAFGSPMDELINTLTGFNYKIPGKIDVMKAKRIVGEVE